MHFNPASFPWSYAFESFGVKIAIHANHPGAIEAVRATTGTAIPLPLKKIIASEADHHFYYRWNKSKRDSLVEAGEIPTIGLRRVDALAWLESRLRLTVAEFAKDHVFVHAGVVAWKGKAVVIPGTSYSGKSTLVAELVRRGAVYYSDEYAVIDKKGHVSPFPKTLSMREYGGYAQTEYPADHFGGRVGRRKAPVGLVLITKFSKTGRWRPVLLSAGQGFLEILKNTIPVRNDPSLSLQVLRILVQNAGCVKTNRREAKDACDAVLDLVERSSPRTGREKRTKL